MHRVWEALAPWGGYWRWVRGRSTGRLWIRRGRCSRCRRSHALLPDFLLERRLDEVEVIGHALALGIAGGFGMRSVADRLGIPMTTAREWRRRFQLRAPALAAALVEWRCSWIRPLYCSPLMVKQLLSKRLALPGSELELASASVYQHCGDSGV